MLLLLLCASVLGACILIISDCASWPGPSLWACSHYQSAAVWLQARPYRWKSERGTRQVNQPWATTGTGTRIHLSSMPPPRAVRQHITNRSPCRDRSSDSTSHSPGWLPKVLPTVCNKKPPACTHSIGSLIKQPPPESRVHAPVLWT